MGSGRSRPARPPPPTRRPVDVAGTDFRQQFEQYLKDLNTNNYLLDVANSSKDRLNADAERLRIAIEKLNADKNWINSIIGELQAEDVKNQAAIDAAKKKLAEIIAMEQPLLEEMRRLQIEEQQLNSEIASLNRILDKLRITYKSLLIAKKTADANADTSNLTIIKTYGDNNGAELDLATANLTAYNAVYAQNNNLDKQTSKMKQTYSIDGSKVTYQNSQTAYLSEVNFYLLLIYYSLLVILFYFIYYNKYTSIYKKIIFVILVSLYPFVIYFLQTNLYLLYKQIYSYLLYHLQIEPI